MRLLKGLFAAQREGRPPDAGSGGGSGCDGGSLAPPDSRFEKALFAAAVLCAIILLAALAAPMLDGKTYFIDDLSWYHLPTRLFYSRCLANGDNFTWMPDIFCGYYLHGDGQVGMYHPLHFVMYRLLPPVAAFNLELFLSYPVMLLGMYLLLRRWEIRRSASMLGAVLFAFSGFNLLHFMHMNAVATVSHVPWLLLSIDQLFRASGLRRVILAGTAVALLTGSQVLLGYPQYVFLSSIAELLYVLFLLIVRRSNLAAGVFIAAKIAGVALGAVQLFPTITAFAEALRHLKPEHGLVFQYSLDPYNLVQLIAPYLLSHRVFHDNTHEYGAYDGMMTFVLVLWGVFALAGMERRRKLAAAALVLILLSIEMSFGGYGSCQWMIAHVPVLNMFRAPSRFLVLAQLGMAVLAAASFEAICEKAERRDPVPWFKCVWLVAIPAVALYVLVIALLPPPRSSHLASLVATEMVADTVPRLAGPILAALAVIVVIAALRGARVAIVAVVLFAAADLGFYGLSYARSEPPRTLAAFAAQMERPPNPGEFRVYSALTYNDRWVLAGYRLASGYAGLWPSKILYYQAPNVLRVAGVRWWTDSKSWALHWQRVNDPLPRARLVTSAVAPLRGDNTISRIDVSSVAVVQDAPSLPGGPAGNARVVTDRPGRIVLETSAPSRQILVVSESFNSGWRATVDGKDAHVERVYGDFIGCVVESGEHTVEFTFHGPGLAAGMLVSGISGLILLAAVIVALVWKPACPAASSMRRRMR